jgi:hypothetical protein
MLSRARTVAALVSVMPTTVEAETGAAAGAVCCKLSRTLTTWLTLSSGPADAAAWRVHVASLGWEGRRSKGDHHLF